MISTRIWTEETVIAAIRAEAAAGHELSYLATNTRVPSLLRAAQRVFGGWAEAVSAAGFDYEAIRRYRVWSKERVLARIREWHAEGADLSWRHVATTLDPPLAAAVFHGNRFDSWADALAEAGLDPAEIARYRNWTLPAIHEELREIHRREIPLTRQHLAREDAGLLAALYRHGDGLVKERRAVAMRHSRRHRASA